METLDIDTPPVKNDRITKEQLTRLLQITQNSNAQEAFDALITRYQELEIDFWKNENIAFENRWQMSFEEFAEKHETWENGQHIDIITQYQDWETAYYTLLFFENKVVK